MIWKWKHHGLICLVLTCLQLKVNGQNVDESENVEGAGETTEDAGLIRHLKAESDYRAVRLQWDWVRSDDKDALRAFQVFYCELQSWGPHRCRTKLYETADEADNIIGPYAHAKVRSYAIDIEGLRMATTYIFEVRPVGNKLEDRSERADDDDLNAIDVDKDNKITVSTKGFSAKASTCLPTISEVDVSTGPFFGGRISVENAEGKERCSVSGEPNSLKDTYTLRINHTECGSFVNETTVTTFIIVQENLPILTHSTRRFLVLCTFQPDTLTVRADLSLPTSGHGSASGSSQVEPFPYDDNNNEVRHSRQIRFPVHSKPDSLSSNFMIMVMLVAVGLVGSAMAAFTCYKKSITSARDDVETMSISSSSSSGSFFGSILSGISSIGSRTEERPRNGVFSVTTPTTTGNRAM